MSPTKAPVSLPKVSIEIQDIIVNSPHLIPSQFNGNGAPGEYLEYLCKVSRNNVDMPDFYDWELKFHGGKSLLTLLHKTPQPKGVMKELVHNFGWLDDKGRKSFRHTLSKNAKRGFEIQDYDEKLFIVNPSNPEIRPYWEHNVILETISSKLRRLIFVEGKYNSKKKEVSYTKATALWDLDILKIIQLIQEGIIIIDFDARTQSATNNNVRDHGTKFRIKSNELPRLYSSSRIIYEGGSTQKSLF